MKKIDTNKIDTNKIETSKIDIFISGRLCLFGEHSDWAGHYRRFNSNISPGYALVCGTEEGIHGTASISDCLKVSTVLPTGEMMEFSSPMQLEHLLSVAQEGGFFSYIAGVAAHLLMFHVIGGIELECHSMTLPLKKGLSSSAAVCVLTARAFNQLYKLNLTTRGEMEAAFYGEQLTPSRCGRLDQACAYGKIPVMMSFNGDFVDAKPVSVGGDLYWVFADLNGKKDTIQILQDLNKAYPFPKSKEDLALHRLFGEQNKAIIEEAVEAIDQGDAQKIGEIMIRAQALFDITATPFSPYELKADKLHEILDDPYVKLLSYGGKGVGSQGDGCVQFIAKDENAKDELISYLKKRGCDAYSITLKKTAQVKRAVITLAGMGTRMYPATKVIQKELLPVVDKDGLAKPALMVLLEEIEAAGIEEIALIVRKDTKQIYENLIHENLIYENLLASGGTIKIVVIEQSEPLGFGHAVAMAHEFSCGEPLLLSLGDHLYESYSEKSCTQQLLEQYEIHKKLMVSVDEIPLDMVSHYGIVSGIWDDPVAMDVMQISKFSEKPSPNAANEYLGVLSGGTKKFFSIFGQYVLTPKVFETLLKNISAGDMENGEYQLTSVLESVRGEQGAIGVRISGRRYDIGIPEKYRETVAMFGKTI